MPSNQHELLETIGETPDVSPIDPNDEAYVAERRKLLGPIADISHPEFGRENTPEETFSLVTKVSHPDGKHNQVRVISSVLDSAGVSVDSALYSSTQQ